MHLSQTEQHLSPLFLNWALFFYAAVPLLWQKKTVEKSLFFLSNYLLS
jgi:hypothetical protein